MKNILFFLSFSLSLSIVNGQSWINCNEVLLTVDDFNTDLDFSNQPVNCGCNNNNGECTLVRIKMTETINGIETPVEYSSIGFMPPLSPPLETNYIQKDYIDIFNPYFQCQEYQAQGILNHSYRFSPVAPSGHELHLLVCPGSEVGQMRGRFTSITPVTTLAAPTNIQASDGQSGMSVTFDSEPGKYYMAYRNTERCNETWVPIEPSMPWPQATGTTMTIVAQSFIPNQQFMYRVVASDQGFVVATDTDGAWSEGDLGHYGSNFIPYDPNNNCAFDCIADVTPPTINCPIATLPLEIQIDGTASATIDDFNITAIDDCDPQVDISDINFDFNCLDLGNTPLYNIVIATDDNGNSSQCQVGVELIDPNNYCSSFCANREEIIDVPPNETGGWFGNSVELDGQNFIIGSYGDDEIGQNVGAAYIYEGPEGNRTINKITPSLANNSSRFGFSTSLDNNIAVVGSPGENNNTGASYIYTKASGIWVESKLTASDASTFSSYGFSTAIDNNTVVIGAYESEGHGKVYVYENGVETILEPSNPEQNQAFGYSVAIENDIIVVGSPSKGLFGVDYGAVYIYIKVNNQWQETFLQSSTPRDRSSFGIHVRISGIRVLIGESGTSAQHGRAYVFEKVGTIWNETIIEPSNSQIGDQFGFGGDILHDELLISAPRANNSYGDFYKYQYNGVNWIETIIGLPITIGPSDFGGATSLSNNGYLIGAWRELNSVGRAYFIHCAAECTHPDIQGLQAFYDDSNGDMWNNTVANDRPWFEDCDPCGLVDGNPWYGITCNNDGRVKWLDVQNNNVTGFISPDINKLSELEWLLLARNKLTGNIPSTLCDLNLLGNIDLSDNQLNGSLPTCLNTLEFLFRLFLHENSLSGSLPDFDPVLQDDLLLFGLNDNQFTGSIPLNYALFPNLSSVNIKNNNLSGCYDIGLAPLCNIVSSGFIISDGNSFDATWDDFCMNGAGACIVSTDDKWWSKKVTMYPNPFIDQIQINSHFDKDIEISFHNIAGELLQRKTIKALSFGHFDIDVMQGVYILKVWTEQKVFTKKMIKL